MTFTFDMKRVRELVAHSKACSKHRSMELKADGKDTVIGAEPGLMFVKDDGVYVLSNGIDGKAGTPSTNGLVHYAKEAPQGTHINGDDYVEFIPASALDGMPESAKRFAITVGKNDFALRYAL